MTISAHAPAAYRHSGTADVALTLLLSNRRSAGRLRQSPHLHLPVAFSLSEAFLSEMAPAYSAPSLFVERYRRTKDRRRW